MRFPRCCGRGRRRRRGRNASRRGRAGGIGCPPPGCSSPPRRLAPRRPRTIRWEWPATGCGPSAGGTPHLALPLWSATPRHLETLALAAGPAWLGGFLTTVTDAAQRAGQDLTRLQSAAARAAALRRTARSHLPAAAALALRSPVLTAAGLAELRLSPQAALGLLTQLVAAGVLKEVTGRAAWRAFVVA